MVYSYLSYVKSQIPVTGKLAPLVLAAVDIAPGEVLSGGMIRVADHPDKWMPAGAIGQRKTALGRTAAVPIFKGEPVTTRKIGLAGGLSSLIPQGMRAYALPASAAAAGAFTLRPGDKVDVLATSPDPATGQSSTTIILRSRQVAPAPAAARGGSGTLSLESRQSGRPITLLVTPDEAQKLAAAESTGKLTLILAPQEIVSQPRGAPQAGT
ncbi:MAG: Flp pilus assembly protein CpaB, partial [Actinomycetota bacterium]